MATTFGRWLTGKDIDLHLALDMIFPVLYDAEFWKTSLG